MPDSRELSLTVDPIAASMDHLLAICFAKTSSKSFDMAVAIARGAAVYGEFPVGKSTLHVAAFKPTAEDAGRAASILKLSRTWKSTKVFVKGVELTTSYDVRAMLECFTKSHQAREVGAWCGWVYRASDHPTREESKGLWANLSVQNILSARERGPEPPEPGFLIPCRQLQGRMRLDLSHPAGVEAQVQAEAVEHGCNACPRFSMMRFREI